MKWLLVVLVLLLVWMFYKIAKFDSQHDVEEMMKRLKEEKEEFKEEMEEVGEVIEDAVEEFVEDVKELFEEEQYCRCKDCHCGEEHDCCKGCNGCNYNDDEE